MYLSKIFSEEKKQSIGKTEIIFFEQPEDANNSISDKRSGLYFQDINKDDNNYYTFIIGDNGVGKTSILNFISEVKNYYPKSSSFFHKVKKILLIPSNKQSSVKEFNECNANQYVLNPQTMDVSSILMLEMHEKNQRLKKLEEILDLTFDENIEISFNYTKEDDKDGTYRLYSICHKEKELIEFQEIFNNFEAERDKRLTLQKYARFVYYQFFVNNSISQVDLNNSKIIKAVCNFAAIAGKSSHKWSKEEIDKTHWQQTSYQICDLSNIDIHLIALLKELDIIEINTYFINKRERKLPCKIMSSGQLQIVKLYTMFSCLPSKEKENLLFLYDEPELSLHPKWQLNFPLYFDEITKLYGIKNSHFIFATHSPLIIMRSAKFKENCSVIKIYRDENYMLKGDRINHIHQYNLNKLLFDEFDFETYPAEERNEILIKLRGHKEYESRDTDNNLLDEVKNSLDIRKKINDMYNEIFNS